MFRRVVENALRPPLKLMGPFRAPVATTSLPRFEHLKALTVTSITKTKRRILYNIFDLFSEKEWHHNSLCVNFVSPCKTVDRHSQSLAISPTLVPRRLLVTDLVVPCYSVFADSHSKAQQLLLKVLASTCILCFGSRPNFFRSKGHVYVYKWGHFFDVRRASTLWVGATFAAP